MCGKTLLSIDGGGIWFTGVVKYLRATDQRLDFKLHSYIDGYAGTSAGALVAALLAFGYTPIEIDELAETEAKKMFDPVGLPQSLNPLRPNLYKGDYAMKLLKRKFGETKIKDVQCPIFLVGTNLATGEEMIFSHEYNAEYPLWKAALISMSAPTYFPPVDGMFGDGGLLANNPAEVLLSGFAHECKTYIQNIRVLSLATSGRVVCAPKKVDISTKIGWASKVIDITLKGNSRIAHFVMKNLPLQAYMRIAPILSKEQDYALDATKNIPEINKIWTAQFIDTKTDVLNFLKGV
jgi:predicted acylesterase/phospholipase RssA